MDEPRTKQNDKDPFDGEYIGNIWGRKFTLYGGMFILFLLGVILFRHWSMGVPFGLEDVEQEETPLPESPAAPADSLQGATPSAPSE